MQTGSRGKRLLGYVIPSAPESRDIPYLLDALTSSRPMGVPNLIDSGNWILFQACCYSEA